MSRGRFDHVNAAAFAIAVAVFTALGLAWWRDHSRHFETPRWNATRFQPVAATPAAATVDGELWVVAVNLACPHCQRHLRTLALRIAGRPHPPRLAALVVDEPRPPDGHVLSDIPLAGGVWWDRAQVWRETWGRRVYGETFRFDSAGALLSSTPVGVVPDSTNVRLD